MANDKNNHVCPVTIAGCLDNKIREWIQNPQKILGPYIEEGMVVLDIGCGPGFFSLEMARMVGRSGQVIAADIQVGMLQILRGKLQGTELEERIILHTCNENKIGVSSKVDFILLFYMVHEVPDKYAFFTELETILRQRGQILIVEPPFHVSQKAFEDTLKIAHDAGLTVTKKPKVLLNKTALLKKINE